jgi:SRSO17 transposase
VLSAVWLVRATDTHQQGGDGGPAHPATPSGARRAEAHVPEQVAFHTKPQLAQQMLARALDAGVPAGWVTADEVYGGDARLRAWLEEHDLAYVLAVKATQPLWAESDRGPAEVAARELVAGLPARAWRRRSAGDGAKGPPGL